MSRLAGLIFSGDDRRGRDLTARMIAGIYQDGWETGNASLGRAHFVWCGWRKPQLAETMGVLAVLDGFIYNRKELGGTESDAKLLVALYQRYGFAGALKRINGDFAAALFEPSTGELLLGRDRFGVKPLYYASTPEFFAFASRSRALLALPGVSREVNRQYVALFAASHYRYFDNHPETSPYGDIAQLPAAHILKFSNGRVTKASYWSLIERPDFAEPEETLAERYRELLIDAVSLRLNSVKHPAFTLSGGMDSSSVLASAVHVTGSKQHAFSTIYADKTYDESHEIKSMLNTKVAKWHPVKIGNPDVFALVEKMIEVHDEPVATATWLSHFILCEHVAERGFSGLFGGLGGDELNAGEHEYFLYRFADLRLAGQEQQLRHEVEKWIYNHDHPVFKKNLHVMEDGFRHQIDFSSPGKSLPDRNRLTRYWSTLNADYFDLKTFEPVMDHPFGSYLKNRTCQDIFYETAPCCLRAEDRQTTHFGLDHFLPFFDHRLVEFMFRIPGTMKIRDGLTKLLLREAMRGILPEETRTRIQKTGWNAPAHLWFSGKGRERLRDIVLSRSFRERGIYNIAEVERLIEEHEQIVSSGAHKENHMMFLWQLVNLERWLDTMKEIR